MNYPNVQLLIDGKWRPAAYGSEGGTEGIDAYLSTKFITQTGV